MSAPPPAAAPPAWRPAARLGGVWAGLEIVLGSFLHNLRVPLRGHAMTALSICLLSAARRRLPRPGLLWRAGLVCACLKAVSPSAVLLGPMAAIAAEGAWMELGARLLPGAAGALLGGGLAMAWIPAHMALKAWLSLGPDGERLARAAWERLSPAFAGAGAGGRGLILGVLSAHFAAGALAAAAGRSAAAASRRTRRAEGAEAERGRPLKVRTPPEGASPRFSLGAAGPPLHLAALFAALFALGAWRPAASLPLCGALLAAWAALYPAALGRLARPGLWGGLLAAAVAAGLLLSPGEAAAASLRMTFRAATLAAGFAALGQELASPASRALLERLGAGPLAAAAAAAFAALPGLAARLPGAPAFLRRPAEAVDALLEGLAEPARVHLVAGPSGSGKSRLLAEAARLLGESGRKAAGLVSPGRWESGRRSGFDLLDLNTGRAAVLSRREGPESWPALAGPFRFSPEGLAFGRRALRAALARPDEAAFVDEAGPLEFSGGGWAEELAALLSGREGPVAVAIRPELAAGFEARWGVRPVRIWAPDADPRELARALAAEPPSAG